MSTAKRTPIVLVRGEGARVWDTRRQGVPRLHRRDRGDRARPLAIRGRRRDPRAGGDAPARLEPLPHPAADPPGQAPGRALVRRPRLLLQLGRGGQRGGDQARAEVRQGDARHRPWSTSSPCAARSTAGRSATCRRRPGEVPPRLRAARAGLQARAVQRPARGRARDRQPDRRHPGRADPGRGRRQRRPTTATCPGCASSATRPARCSSSTRSRPAWAGPGGSGPTSTPASSPTS